MMHEIGLDRIQHGFWRFMDPTHRDYHPNHRYRDVIRQYYQYLDDQIEELLQLFDDDTSVMVVSDHGSQKMEGAIWINEWLAREGYLAFTEPPTRSCRWRGPGGLGSRTRVWGEGGHYARLCLNVRGREAQGMRRSSRSRSRCRDELIAGLKRWAVRKVSPSAPASTSLRTLWAEQRGIPPDLVVYLGDLAWRSNGSIGSGQIYSFENDTGARRREPHPPRSVRDGWQRGAARRVADLTIYDVAPTILAEYGLSVPARMQGRGLAWKQAAAAAPAMATEA